MRRVAWLKSGNVVFNGPRAMYNFNDGMIGGDNVHANLLANAVRIRRPFCHQQLGPHAIHS